MFTLLLAASLSADPILIAKPDAFQTLVNPNCSHCVDEWKRRKDELKANDPVLCWTRGYSDGGAIPIRFFLNTYRVISDSYGVFVYDPDAGYARGFAPSYNFVFHGWRNGIMVMKDKTDGTLYSCLSGEAFDGPRKGHRLTPIPTLVTTWGEVMARNPNAVAYQMFEKYKPVELPKKGNDDSLKSRPTAVDSRLKPEELVLGVRVGNTTKAYPLTAWQTSQWYHEFVLDNVGGVSIVVMWKTETKSASAYRLLAHAPRKYIAPQPNANGVSPPDPGVPVNGKVEPDVNVDVAVLGLKGGSVLATKGGTNADTWDIAGRCQGGTYKGWALEPVDAVVCTWRAWSTEYPNTEVFGQDKSNNPKTTPVDPNVAVKQVAGSAEFLRLLPKPFGVIKSVDPKANTVTLLLDGEKVSKVWPVEPDAEIKVAGWWGRLEQFNAGQRVWVWLKLDRNKNAKSVVMLADEISEQVIHGIRWNGITRGSFESGPIGESKATSDYTLTFGKETKTVIIPGRLRTDTDPYLLHTLEKNVPDLLNEDQYLSLHRKQKAWLRDLWQSEGLPGTATFIHVFSGEMDVMLDHEAMRWGRSLKYGDQVELTSDPPIKAIVKSVTPWRERTQLRLVVGELQSSELKAGQRIGVKMAWLPKDVDDSPYPTDIDRPRTKAERIEWFLASMYCVCGVGDDICTGDFYTLASCNPNGCGAPNQTRKEIGKLIDAGKTDKQIWDALVKERGPEMTRPHLRK
jgi:hypothetical protein